MARILVVDDEKGMLNILTFFLEKEGHEVWQASDVPTALARLKEEPVDVVVSDIIMPGPNGVELLETLQKQGSRTKVILITGEPTVETAIQAVRSGAFEYIPKPVSRGRLVKAVADAIHVKNLEDENREYKHRLEQMVARRTEELRQANRQLEEINQRLRHILESTRRLSAINDFTGFGKMLLEEFGEHMGATGGSLYLLEDNVFRLVHALDPGHAPAELPLPLTPGSLLDKAFRLKIPQVVQDITKDGSVAPSPFENYSNGSAMILPLMDESFEVFGILSLHAKQQPPFSMKDLEVGSILLSLGSESLRAIRAHEKLERSEERYRLLAENATDVIWSLDMNLRYTYVSPSIIGVSGFTAEESMSMTLDQALAPTSLEKALELFREEWQREVQGGMEKDRLRIFEAELRHKDGGYVWTEISARFLRNGEGNAVGILGITRDIHERRKMQEALESRERLFRTVFDLTPTSISIVDLHGRYMDVNRSMCEASRLAKEDILGRTTYELYDYADPDASKAIGTKVVQTGESLNDRVRIRRGAGQEWLDLLLSSRLIEIEGKPFILSVANDISPLLKMKEERERLLAAIEQTGEVIVITDPEGNIQYVNPAFERITGYSKEEAIGQNPRILKSGQHTAEFYETLWKTIRGGKTWTGRIINKKKNGILYTDEATISPVLDESGTIRHFIAVKRDISKTLEMERQFIQAQRMESIGRLAGGVAHDFNNLLTAIGGHVELGLMDLVPEDPLSNHFKEIRAAAVRAGKLTRQLLAFSRRQVMEAKVLDLNEVVRGVEGMLLRLIGENVRVHRNLAEGILPVNADAGKLEQVLVNLCVNARDAMPEGGEMFVETSAVTLDSPHIHKGGTLPAGDYIRLTVRDRGLGMSAEILDKLFEPFFTTKP